MLKTGCNNNNNNNNNSNNCILIIIFTGNSLQSIQSKLPKLSWHSGNSRGSTTGCAHVCLMSVSCKLVVVFLLVTSWKLVCGQCAVSERVRVVFGDIPAVTVRGWWGQRSVLVRLAAQAEALLRLQVEPENKGLLTHEGFNSSSLEFSKGPGLCGGWGAWLSYSRETQYLPCEQGAHRMTVNSVFEVV